jgi:hypothetical protein
LRRVQRGPVLVERRWPERPAKLIKETNSTFSSNAPLNFPELKWFGEQRKEGGFSN